MHRRFRVRFRVEHDATAPADGVRHESLKLHRVVVLVAEVPDFSPATVSPRQVREQERGTALWRSGGAARRARRARRFRAWRARERNARRQLRPVRARGGHGEGAHGFRSSRVRAGKGGERKRVRVCRWRIKRATPPGATARATRGLSPCPVVCPLWSASWWVIGGCRRSTSSPFGVTNHNVVTVHRSSLCRHLEVGSDDERVALGRVALHALVAPLEVVVRARVADPVARAQAAVRAAAVR